MKYAHSVQTPEDVEHGLGNQLAAYGKCVLCLVKETMLERDWFKYVLLSKNNARSLLPCKSPFSTHSNCLCRFSCNFGNEMSCMERIQPHLSLNADPWTQGLLHDSEFTTTNDKMDDYFSTLFYDNEADEYCYNCWNKSDGWKSDAERIHFYNKQNLLSSAGSERLYERNVEMDKLIAKFNANVQDIWRTSSDSDHYQNLLSQNFFPNPYTHYGSNLIWSFEQKENAPKRTGLNLNDSGYKSSNPPTGLDSVLTAFNATLSSIQKCPALEPYNHGPSHLFPNRKVDDFPELLYTKTIHKVTPAPQYQVPDPSPNSNEEEDLLTSAKTHFRPIRAEELAGSQTGTYADGTTFAISNDLDKVSFKRSESGLLYLEADANTPRKYMEFKEKEGGGNKGEWDSDVSSGEEFVPKFCLRQSNEKCIQTDEIEEETLVASAENDTDGESGSCKSEDEFYFPGDQELAQNIVNTMEDDSKKEECVTSKDLTCRKLDVLEMSLYQMAELKPCVCGGEKDWNQNSIAVPKQTEWSQIWKIQTSCDGCRSNSEKLSTKDRYRLREELTREGEQLLLDLSSLQQMYSNSDWCDDDDDDDDDDDIDQDVDDDNDNDNDSISRSDSNDGDFELSRGEEVIGGSDLEYPGKGAWWSTLIAKQEPVKNGFDLRCLWKEEKLFSDSLRNDKNSKIGRESERKRRNSSSLKACNPYMEGQCRRSHCRFSHVDTIIGCLRGEPCAVFHGSRRPLSL